MTNVASVRGKKQRSPRVWGAVPRLSTYVLRVLNTWRFINKLLGTQAHAHHSLNSREKSCLLAFITARRPFAIQSALAGLRLTDRVQYKRTHVTSPSLSTTCIRTEQYTIPLMLQLRHCRQLKDFYKTQKYLTKMSYN